MASQFLTQIFGILLLTSLLNAYPGIENLPAINEYNAGIPTSQESLPYKPAGGSYNYQSPISISREDSYSGIDSYGVPLDGPILTTPPPATGTGYGAQSAPAAAGTGYGAQSSPSVTGTGYGYGAPSAPVATETGYEYEAPSAPAVYDYEPSIPSYPAEETDAEEDDGLSEKEMLLALGLGALFLWPRIKWVDVEDTDDRRKNQNKTEDVTEELLDDSTTMTEAVEDTTTILPRTLPDIERVEDDNCSSWVLCRVEQLAAAWTRILYTPRVSR